MPQEVPPQSYFPSARLRLIVRLDEFGADDIPPAPERPPHLRTGKGRSDAKLAVVEKNGQLILLGPDDNPDQTGGPQAQTSSTDARTFVIEVIPSRISINRNGVRTADTMSATWRFLDLPIDPRTIRSCAVEVFMGTSTEEENAQLALTGKLSVIPDFFIDDQGRRRSNRRFSGWVDEMEQNFGDDDAPSVNIECTDNSRLIIEQDAPPKLAVSPDEPIDKAVANYLSNFPQFRGFGIEYRPIGSSIPLLSSALGKTAYKPKLGPTPGAGSKLTVWDYLTDICGAVGHICRVDGETIVIQRARTLYGSQFPGRPDDPFTGRVLTTGRNIDKRLFVYGRNIKRPRFRRKFARFAPFNVEVRSYSPKIKRTLVARFPLKGDRQKQPRPGNATEQVWKVFPVQGVEDEASLRAIAQGIYESVGRNELEVEFETVNLGSYGGGATDPDCLDAQPGDAIEVEVIRDFDANESVANVDAALRTRPEAFLRQLGFAEDFASAYAQAVSNIGLTTVFRLKTLGLEWDIQDGIKLSFTGINYVEVSGDKALLQGEEPVAVPSDVAQPSTVNVGKGF